MALKSYDNLNSFHLDVFKEICNIGSGNAAKSISDMFGIKIDIEIPGVELLDINEAIIKLGGAEAIRAGLLLPTSEDLNGMIMFLFRHEFANLLLKQLMGIEVNSFDELDEMGFSMLNEVSNVAAAGFINAIAQMTGMTINLAPPASTVDMVGAIMNVPAVYFANISDKILLMENRFNCDGLQANTNILLIPDIESLERLMIKLGVEI